MTLRFSTIGLFTSVCLLGCSHGGANDVAHSPTGDGSSRARFAASASEPSTPRATAFSEGAAAPAAAPASDMKSAAAGAAAAERPGLGTSWGESVSSRVAETSFTRANDGRPDATATFFYNDESGVAAAARSRFTGYGESVQELASGALTVSLMDGNGRPLRAAQIDGHAVAVGSDGDRYVVHVDNRTPFRVEAVATVDGLDVMDGSPGSVENRGYVIAPHDTLDIEGFRDSAGTVRAFRFGSVKDSYASRRGDDRNVGVVGIAVFAEAGTDWRWTPSELDRRGNAEPFPRSFAPAPGL